MDPNNESFAENLDRLMFLLNIYKEKKYSNQNVWLSNTILSNFETIVYNYYRFKDDIPREILDNMREPFQQIIGN